MKKIILLAALMISLSGYAQVADSLPKSPDQMFTHINKAANSLNKFHRQAIISLATEFFGATLIAGAYIDTEKPSKALLASGLAVGTFGFLMFMDSFFNVHDASMELKKIKPASTGVGIAYSF